MQKGENYIPGAYLRAIITNSESNALALPRTAFVKKGESHYVFVVKEKSTQGYQIKEVLVEIGRSTKEHYEVLNLNSDEVYLVNGVYNLLVE